MDLIILWVKQNRAAGSWFETSDEPLKQGRIENGLTFEKKSKHSIARNSRTNKNPCEKPTACLIICSMSVSADCKCPEWRPFLFCSPVTCTVPNVTQHAISIYQADIFLRNLFLRFE
jgi:hypothetical protein